MRIALAALLLSACAARLAPAQAALLQKADCRELLLEADKARAAGHSDLAHDLASACQQSALTELVDAAPTPAEKLLWCGRARAAIVERAEKPLCSAEQVVAILPDLKPRLSLGPADPEAPPDPVLVETLSQIGPELRLSYDHEDPVVFLGQVVVTFDKTEAETVTSAPGPDGKNHQIAATLHRVVARAEAQVELGARTRTLHATEEARDLTWQGDATLAINARFEPQLLPEADLRRRAVARLVRNLARALASSPPESIDVTDAQSCVAYGIAVAVATGNRVAAASGIGDEEKIASCEKILGMAPGAGIPVP